MLARLSESIFKAAEVGGLTRLQQTAPAKVAKIAARGAFDQIDGELQQAHLPGVVDTVNDRA